MANVKSEENVALSFLKKAVVLASADRIAKKASSQEAFDSGVGTAFSDPAIIELYFHKYGSTERKFDLL